MKKAILTFGLFSMIMVLTSFTTPGEIGGNSTPRSGADNPTPYHVNEIGGNSTPRSGATVDISEIGGNSTPRSGYMEIGGNSTPRSGVSV